MHCAYPTLPNSRARYVIVVKTFSIRCGRINSRLNFLKFLGSVCSGNGACGYSDPSGNNITSCAIFDYRCKASCACTDGFSGKDCTLSTIALVQRNGFRYVLPSLLLLYFQTLINYWFDSRSIQTQLMTRVLTIAFIEHLCVKHL